jgi:hypothetical protein
LNRIRIASRVSIVTVVAVAVLTLTGCATGESAKATGAWTGTKPAQPYTRVMVVGVSPNLKTRCAFERSLAARIVGEQTRAVASCDAVDKEAPLSREAIEQAVAAQQVDAVIATLLVSQDWAAESGGSSDTRGSAGYKATGSGWRDGYYGMYGVPVVYGEFSANAESLVIQGKVHLTSKVWETRGPSVVYTVDTVASGIESQDAGISLLSTTIRDELHRQVIVH